MKNILYILAFGAVATVAYFQTAGSNAFAGPSSAPTAIAAPSDISTKNQAAVPDGWITDFPAALKLAKEENKSVLIDFTGSDWCGWCIKLDKEVFSKPEFEEYAKDNLIRVYLDFPSKKAQTEALAAQNEELASKYGIQGFPTILVLNSDGKPIGKTGYQRGGPEKYIEHLQEIIGDKSDT